MTAPLNFADRARNAVAAQAARGATAPSQNDQPKAQVYLNIGVTIPMPKPDGSTEDVFVSLPFGLALDTMNDTRLSTSNSEWNDMAELKNLLRDELLKMAEEVKPGEASIVPSGIFDLQIRRVGEAARNPSNTLMEAFKAKLMAKAG